MKNQKGSAVVWVLILIVILIIIGGIYFYSRNSSVQTTTVSASQPTTGTQVPTVSINLNPANQNQVSTTTSTNISVPGMTDYTDSNLGFMFWHPSGWQIINNALGITIQNGTVIKTFSVNGAGTQISIEEVTSPTMTVTDTGGAGPIGPITYFFDPSLHEWMKGAFQSQMTGNIVASSTADISVNTMGGLHMFNGTSRFSTVIIPLSAENFLVINEDYGGGTSVIPFAKTVTALDPSVATPVSAVEQIKTIQAEATAYGISGQ